MGPRCRGNNLLREQARRSGTGGARLTLSTLARTSTRFRSHSQPHLPAFASGTYRANSRRPANLLRVQGGSTWGYCQAPVKAVTPLPVHDLEGYMSDQAVAGGDPRHHLGRYRVIFIWFIKEKNWYLTNSLTNKLKDILKYNLTRR